MPRPQFVPHDHTLPRTQEARPVGLNFDTVFRSTREHSKTEGLARLLMPKACERVERLRSMKRARILRERAEEEAAEAAAEQSRTDEGLEPAEGPPTVPDTDATNIDDQDSAPSTVSPPAAPPSQPPSPPASDTGAVYAGAPPAASPSAPKRVRFDPDAATGANAHPPAAVPGAFPPMAQPAAPPALPPTHHQSTPYTSPTSTPQASHPVADPTSQLPPAAEVEAQLNNATAAQKDQHVYSAAPHYGPLACPPYQYVIPSQISAAVQYSTVGDPTRGDVFNEHRIMDGEYRYNYAGDVGSQWVWPQQSRQYQAEVQEYQVYQQRFQQIRGVEAYTQIPYTVFAMPIPMFDRARPLQHERSRED